MEKRIFLSATWEYLAMFNFEVDAAVLKQHLPPYTEIDYFDGKALVSVVGFLFDNTKVLGVKWPGHINFEEVNLRYYVKHFDGNQWKRGVGCVSEIVPKYMIATLANRLYNEHYSVAAMRHLVDRKKAFISVEYSWQKDATEWQTMKVNALDRLEDIKPAAEEFILEHYFGYNKLNALTTVEYAVKHPAWQVYTVKEHELICNIEKLYGKAFVPFIVNQKPHSVFLARGSDVTIGTPIKIRGEYK